jgi:hypothetical protein
MRLSNVVILPILAPIFAGGSAFADNCRTVSDLQIRAESDIQRWNDVCVVEGSLSIFADGVEKIVLPNLVEAGVINIDTHGLRALAMPKLTHATDLYLNGIELEVAELPSLQTVSGHFVVQAPTIRFLNLPNLIQVNRLVLKGCSNLEFVFVDKLGDVGSFLLEQNPKLNEGSASMLTAVTRNLTPNEQDYVINGMNRVADLKIRLHAGMDDSTPMPTTGHPTTFDSFGFIKHYYDWYPYEYHDYWLYLRPWGFTLWYPM